MHELQSLQLKLVAFWKCIAPGVLKSLLHHTHTLAESRLQTCIHMQLCALHTKRVRVRVDA